MITKSDLENLALLRLEDANVLLKAKRYSAAYYLAGYAVELALKACIAKLIRQNTIPDKAFISAIYVHKLDSLLGTAGLLPELDAELKENQQLAAYWAITNNWSEQSRYDLWDPCAATSLVHAINNPNGVFQWVKKHW